MLEIEVIGAARELSETTLVCLCELALASAGVADGHLAVELVDEARMRALNRAHRDRDVATDVLSFPIDGQSPPAGPRELGDVIVCPERCDDVAEAVLHGALHLAGMDHERDGGEMLALQRELIGWLDADGTRS